MFKLYFTGLFKFFYITFHHFFYQHSEVILWLPVQFGPCFGSIAYQQFHFRWPEIFGVNSHYLFT